MNGAWDSFASRREISVFPTPVGPIMMMFLGMTSSRKCDGSRWRRHRVRSAIATIRLASRCPMTYRSSSSTIWRGVKLSSPCACLFSLMIYLEPEALTPRSSCPYWYIYQCRRQSAPIPRQYPGIQIGVAQQRPRGGQGIRPAGPDRQDAVFRLDDVAGPRDDQGMRTVGDGQQRLELSQHAVRPPVLRELHSGPHQVPPIFLELRIESLEQGKCVRGRARKSRQHSLIIHTTKLLCVVLHHRRAERHLSVARHRDVRIASHA